MTELNWFKAFSFEGDWWVPGDKGVVVPGTLSSDPVDGIRLRLHGSLLTTRQMGPKVPVLHGVAQEIGALTLQDILVTNATRGINDRETLLVGAVVLDEHLAASVFQSITKVAVEFDGINAIPNRKSWSIKYEPLRISAKVPFETDPICFGDLTLQVRSVLKPVSSEEQITVSSHLVFDLAWEAPQPIDRTFVEVSRFQQLLALLTFAPIRESDMRIWLSERSQPLHIISAPFHGAKPTEVGRWNLLWATLMDGRFKDVAVRWLGESEGFHQAASVLMFRWYVRRFIEEEFLDATRVVDAYYRCRNGRGSFRKELDALMARLPSEIRDAVCMRPGWEKAVKDLRDELTHELPILTPVRCNIPEALSDIDRLVMVMHLVILNDLGFDFDEVLKEPDFKMHYYSVLSEKLRVFDA